MGCTSNGSSPAALYALVSYIPDPLGSFLDDLRREMVPECMPKAHVTILPPRVLAGDPRGAAEALERWSRNFPAFEVELGEVSVFRESEVIYLSIARGQEELRRMYHALNRGPLDFREKFPYHPHITLAQGIRHEEVQQFADLARRRWAEYRGACGFRVEVLAFVRNCGGTLWDDLANIELAKPEECLVS